MSGTGQFNPAAVRIVDFNSTNRNLLVRGTSAFGAQIVGTGVAFTVSDLVQAIQNDPNYASTGIQISANPFVIDICLIGFGVGSNDQEYVASELTWFTTESPSMPGVPDGNYPLYIQSTQPGNSGVMVYWPVNAIGGCPPCSVGGSWPAATASSILPGATNYNFAGLISTIAAALNNQTAQLPQGGYRTPPCSRPEYVSRRPDSERDRLCSLRLRR